MNAAAQIRRLGQTLWFKNITRGPFASTTVARYIRAPLSTAVFTGATILSAGASAQPSHAYGPGYGMRPGMMDGYGFDWMGGYSGILVPILLVFIIAGLAVWVIVKKTK